MATFVKPTSFKEGKMFEISGGKLVASVVSTASALELKISHLGVPLPNKQLLMTRNQNKDVTLSMGEG